MESFQRCNPVIAVTSQDIFWVMYFATSCNDMLVADSNKWGLEQSCQDNFTWRKWVQKKGSHEISKEGVHQPCFAEFINHVLQGLNMGDAKRASQHTIGTLFKVPYASAIGILMYATVCIRTDNDHAVVVVSRFMSNWRLDWIRSVCLPMR